MVPSFSFELSLQVRANKIERTKNSQMVAMVTRRNGNMGWLDHPGLLVSY